MGSASNHHDITHAQEIIALVREGDYDRFLAIQLAPKAKRAALYALTAFHIEIARIADIVSEPMLGHIRLAWWREAVAEIIAGKAPRHHPVMLALAPVLTQQPILADYLYAMLDARATDVEGTDFADEAAWVAYADGTVGALHHAWAWVLDDKAAAQQQAMITSHARACALVAQLRAIPMMAAQGWVRFPPVQLAADGVASLAPSSELNAMVLSVIKQVSILAGDSELGGPLKPLVGVAALHRLTMRRLVEAGGNPYQSRIRKLGKVWAILKLTKM